MRRPPLLLLAACWAATSGTNPRKVLWTGVFGGRFVGEDPPPLSPLRPPDTPPVASGQPTAPGHELEANATLWTVANRDAITGVLPCCGCFGIGPDTSSPHNTNLTFSVNTDPASRGDAQHHSTCGDEYFSNPTLRKLGIQNIPQGGVDMGPANHTDFSGMVAQAVAGCRKHGFDGLNLDNEMLSSPQPSEPLAAFARRYSWLIGNLSAAFAENGLQLAVDVSDTWSGDVCGPPFIADYARQAPAARMYDMMCVPRSSLVWLLVRVPSGR